MLAHDAAGASTCSDFFVEAGGAASTRARGELTPVEIVFDETPRSSTSGPPRAAFRGRPPASGRRRGASASMPVRELVAPAVRNTRGRACGVTRSRRTCSGCSSRSSLASPETRRLYAPDGRLLRGGRSSASPSSATRSSGSPRTAPTGSTGGDGARGYANGCAIAAGCSPEDFAAYGVVERAPVAGGVPRPAGPDEPAAVVGRGPDRVRARAARAAPASRRARRPRTRSRSWRGDGEAQRARPRFHRACTRRVLRRRSSRRPHLRGRGTDRGPSLIQRASSPAGEALGSTTHISVLDPDGNAASVTCSNGTGSGVLPPGTGMHLNNMLGEAGPEPARLPSARAGDACDAA